MSFDTVLPPYNASDPTATFLSSSCLDLLLIELVPLAYRIANELDVPSQRQLAAGPATASSQQPQQVQHPPGAPPTAGSSAAGTAGGGASTSGRGVGIGPGARRLEDDEERDAVFFRLETLGYRVGQGLVERCVWTSGRL